MVAFESKEGEKDLYTRTLRGGFDSVCALRSERV